MTRWENYQQEVLTVGTAERPPQSARVQVWQSSEIRGYIYCTTPIEWRLAVYPALNHQYQSQQQSLFFILPRRLGSLLFSSVVPDVCPYVQAVGQGQLCWSSNGGHMTGHGCFPFCTGRKLYHLNPKYLRCKGGAPVQALGEVQNAIWHKSKRVRGSEGLNVTRLDGSNLFPSNRKDLKQEQSIGAAGEEKTIYYCRSVQTANQLLFRTSRATRRNGLMICQKVLNLSSTRLLAYETWMEKGHVYSWATIEP